MTWNLVAQICVLMLMAALCIGITGLRGGQSHKDQDKPDTDA